MFDHWLVPSVLSEKKFAAWQFGENIVRDTEKTPTMSPGSLCLIGIDAEAADAIRTQLFELGWHFGKLSVIDLGNTRRSDRDFVAPILTELLRNGVIPVILGGESAQIITQHLAYQTQPEPINITVIDRAIVFSPDDPMPESYLYAILTFKNAHLAQCSMIGYQTHLSVAAGIKYLDERGTDSLRLGRVRDNIEAVEPILRDSDMVAIHLAAIKYSDAPSVFRPCPVGLTAEESMRVGKYAGLSTKLRSFGIFGLLTDTDNQQITAQTAAQIIWYFCDGFRNRIADHPSQADQLTEYVVPFKRDYRISFWKNLVSGRWWMEIPNTQRKSETNMLIACSYKDYEQAGNGEMPERLLNALKRQK